MSLSGINFEIGGAVFALPKNTNWGRVERTFRPDFRLISVLFPGGKMDAKIEGRTVFLEVHGSCYFNERFADKLSAFMKSDYHKENYLALAVDNQDINKVNYVLNHHGLKKEDIADKFWYLEVWRNRHELISKRERYYEHMKHLERLKQEMDTAKMTQFLRS